MKEAPVQPNDLDSALNHVRKGGALIVRTYTQIIVIDRKTLANFEAAGQWLLKTEGNGYRLRKGKGSVYLLPGQLKYSSGY